MDKVKITQEQADAINLLKSRIFEKNIIQDHVMNQGNWKGEAQALNEVDLDTLICALYIGYEVEETPEDKVRAFYKSLKPGEDWEPNDYQKACGVQQTLALLGIKIAGVNHE